MRAKPLFDTALHEATSSLVPALEELTGRVIHRYQAKKIAEDTIRAYLAVAKDQEARRIGPRISQESRQMAGLEIGESVVVPAQTFQSIRNRMTTARKLMENDDAKWRCEATEGGITITRTVDGARWWRDPTRNEKAVELAAMAPGDKRIAKTIKTLKGRGQMGTNTKIAARKILEDPAADWAAQTTAKGILIHRTR